MWRRRNGNAEERRRIKITRAGQVKEAVDVLAGEEVVYR